MEVYSLVLFLHFLGMVALFAGYGLEWTSSTLLRSATTGDQARAWLRIYRLSLPVSGPGLLVLLLTGGYLAGVTGISGSGWVLATFGGIAVALFIGFGLLMPRFKAVRAALPEGAASLPAEVLAKTQDPAIVTLIRARFVLALGIVLLMTLKPSLGVSFLVLLVSLVLGALCALRAWSRK